MSRQIRGVYRKNSSEHEGIHISCQDGPTRRSTSYDTFSRCPKGKSRNLCCKKWPSKLIDVDSPQQGLWKRRKLEKNSRDQNVQGPIFPSLVAKKQKKFSQTVMVRFPQGRITHFSRSFTGFLRVGVLFSKSLVVPSCCCPELRCPSKNSEQSHFEWMD